MAALRFVRRHGATYLRITLLGLALVLSAAMVQINFVHGIDPSTRNYIVPVLLGGLIGLLFATLVALRQEVLEAQRKLRAVADMAQEFIYLRRNDGSYEYVSPSCLQLTGYAPRDFYATPSFMTSLVHADDRPVWDRHVHRMTHEGVPEKLVVRIRTKNGEERWIQHLCSEVRDEQGGIVGLRSSNLDITDRVRHEQELALAAVAFETREAIVITDRAARILRVNRAFTEVTGFTPEEVVGWTPALLKSGRHDAAFYAVMWNKLLAEGSWVGELWDRRKNGEIYPKFLTITAVRGADGEIAYFVGTFSDITARKAAEEEINRLAYYDPLTHLPNRRLLVERLHQEMAASERSGRHGAILFIDLDHFKNLNDTRGHDMGDRLLVEVAHRLQSCVRTEDTVARLGGDEFVVMLCDLDAEAGEAARQVEAVADKILCGINQPYHLKDHYYEGSSSIGITLFHGQGESSDELLKHADVALYRAKDAGRATLRFFDPAMQALLDERAELESDLRSALSQHQFVLHYQVQVDARGAAIGAEALLRWRHPARGLVAPGEFVPFAEECGLIVPIGRWVLHAACEQLKAWENHERTRALQLAANISAHQFMQDDFVADTLRLVRASGIAPERLKLELTESALIGNIDEAVEKIRILKASGIHLALDDFGTGYSSLAYLQRLPLDQLKIDRSFVLDSASSGGATIAQTIIGMGRNLGLNVIAEGVETREQFEFLQHHGCHAYQGYFFSRPLPLEDFERWVLDGENGTLVQ